MTKPFVGRRRELDELESGLADAASGRGGFFLVAGEMGIGKTRIADELVARATGFRVAWGRCWQGDGAPAYWPWIQVLRAFGAELPLATAVSDGAHARFALFEQVLGILVRAGEAAPCLVVLDDLHAADPSSLVLLRLVVNELRSLRVAIVGTCRDQGSRRDSEVAKLLAGVTRESTYVPLRRLSAAEVSAVAGQMGVTLSEKTAASVFEVTEGNPLFVDQLLRVVAARDEPADRIAIPFSVREAVRERLAFLRPDARAVLEAAAVLGQEASLELLASVSRDRDLERHIATALEAGALIERGDRRVAFAHILLRDEIYAAIERDRRLALHAAAAEASVAQPLDARAHHALEARDVLGAEPAAAIALRAVEQAIELLAFEDAAALAERALSTLEPSLGPAAVVDLQLARGLAFIRAGQTERGKHACERAADTARAANDTVRLARAALTYGAEHTPSVVHQVLVKLLEESLAALPPTEPALRARVRARLAAALQPATNPAIPMEMARVAIAEARPLDAATRRAVFYDASSALADWGDPIERIQLDKEMVELATGAGDKVQALRSHARLVFDFMEAGDVPSADSHLALHESLAQEFREPRYRWHAPLMRSMRALFDGRLEDADRHQAEAAALMEGEREGAFEATYLWQRTNRLLEEDRFEELAAIEPRMRALAAGFAHARLVIQVHVARVATRRRDRETVEQALASIGPALPTAGPLVAGWLAEAYAFAARPPQLESMYVSLLPFAHRFFNTGLSGMTVEPPVARLLGLLAAASGRASDAVRHLDDAIARTEPLGARRWVERMRRERAEAAGARAEHYVPLSEVFVPKPASFTLALEGEYFSLRYGETVVRLKDSRGLRILAHLVEHAGQEHHVLVLAGSVDGGDAGDVIDREAGAQYRRRVEELRGELAEAERFSDRGRVDRLREELDAIGAELARGFGIGGRARKAASDSERARINVQRHLKKAIQKIGESAPPLEKHLQWAVKTGTYCSYRPS